MFIHHKYKTNMKNFKDVLKSDYKIVLYGIDPEYDEDYIVETLYAQNLAKVRRIMLVPYVDIEDGEVYMSAYIEMHAWNTCEYATNFIKMLQNCPENCCLYLYHYHNLKWPVCLIDDVNIVFNLGYNKVKSTYYNLEYYKNINWDLESNTMELVKAEFIAKQCADDVLNS